LCVRGVVCSCFYCYPIALQRLPWLCPPSPLTISSTSALSSLPHYREVFKAQFHSHVYHTAQPKVCPPTHPLLLFTIPQPNLLLLPSGNIQSYDCLYSSYTLIYCNTTYISRLIVGKLGTLQGNVPAEDGDGQTRPTVYTSSFYHRTWLKTSCSTLLCKYFLAESSNMHVGCVRILDLPLLEPLGEAVSLLQKEALLVWCVHVATLHEGMVLGLTERGRYAGGVGKRRKKGEVTA